MTVPSSLQLYGVGQAPSPSGQLGGTPFVTSRPPASTDVQGPWGPWKLGQIWVDSSASTAYTLVGLTASSGSISATWDESAGSGALNTLTGDTGTATPSSGNIQIAGTASQITSTASGSAVTLSLPLAISAPGTLTVATDISSTAGNISIVGEGKQLRVEGGAVTDFIGTGTLAAGTVTIANTNIAATDRIFISRIASNGSTTFGVLSYTISAGASFTVTSLILGTPGSTQTGDTSTFAYFIVRQL